MKLPGTKNLMKKIFLLIKKFKIGDWFVIIMFISLIFFITKYYWDFPEGQYLKIERNKDPVEQYKTTKNKFLNRIEIFLYLMI